jgi:hypothetical protein
LLLRYYHSNKWMSIYKTRDIDHPGDQYRE